MTIKRSNSYNMLNQSHSNKDYSELDFQFF